MVPGADEAPAKPLADLSAADGIGDARTEEGSLPAKALIHVILRTAPKAAGPAVRTCRPWAAAPAQKIPSGRLGVFGEWLGHLDSNQDRTVQSRVFCR